MEHVKHPVLGPQSPAMAYVGERNAQIFEQSLKLQQENVKVFQEILAELKKLSARP